MPDQVGRPRPAHECRRPRVRTLAERSRALLDHVEAESPRAPWAGAHSRQNCRTTANALHALPDAIALGTTCRDRTRCRSSSPPILGPFIHIRAKKRRQLGTTACAGARALFHNP